MLPMFHGGPQAEAEAMDASSPKLRPRAVGPDRIPTLHQEEAKALSSDGIVGSKTWRPLRRSQLDRRSGHTQSPGLG